MQILFLLFSSKHQSPGIYGIIALPKLACDSRVEVGKSGAIS
jgi:hypothetical protein